MRWNEHKAGAVTTIPPATELIYSAAAFPWFTLVGMRCLLSLLFLSLSLSAEYRVGVGRVDITPAGPIWMSGYASRTHPSTGVAGKLWAKALAFDDGRGGRAVVVTTDLIGLPASVSDVVAARVLKQFELPRSGLLLNSSHTHSGPVIRGNLSTMFTWTAADEATVNDYTAKLVDHLVAVVGSALGDLAPAKLEYAVGQASFGINRREFTQAGVKIGHNPAGAVDPSVPVLKVTERNGKLRAVLFGYSCHNTTLTGEFYRISGDYASAAQAELERVHPGATALFLMLTGGDQNPKPRSAPEYVEQHGRSLASAVENAIAGKMEKVGGAVRSSFLTTDLKLQPYERQEFETLKGDTNPIKVRFAKEVLRAFDERRPVQTVPYPAQAVRLGKDVGLLALGGEVVVGYGLRAKRQYPKVKLMVAGYSNDVMCYLPTRKILEEGGYEAVDSMLYYGKPAPFALEVEERVFELIGRVMQKVGF